QFDKSKTIINNQHDTNHKLNEIVIAIREIKAQTTVTHTIKDLMHILKYPSDDKLRSIIKITLDNDHPEKMQQYS
ncbi:11651_t:CDS:2, partial [Funneliformis geosporum]